MQIRQSKTEDLDIILEIYAHAREYMRRSGNPTQWGDNRPPLPSILKDIEDGNHYIIEQDGKACGVFSFIIGRDITYDYIEDGQWPNDEPYGTVHKLASSGQVSGIFDFCIAYCEARMNNVRIDTHRDNVTMRHLLEKNGYRYCGIIYVDDGTPRVAYQKTVNEA